MAKKGSTAGPRSGRPATRQEPLPNVEAATAAEAATAEPAGGKPVAKPAMKIDQEIGRAHV